MCHVIKSCDPVSIFHTEVSIFIRRYGAGSYAVVMMSRKQPLRYKHDRGKSAHCAD